MSQTWTLVAAAVGVLFFGALLALVSASEQVFLAITETELRRLRERGNGRASRVLEYVREPHRVIVTTTLSSGVFFAGAILSFLLLITRGEPTTAGQIVGPGLLAGFVLAVLARALPRTLVSAHPEKAAFHLVGMFRVVDTIFLPLVWLVRRVLARVSDEAEDDLVAAEEFKAVAVEDDEAPRLEEEKRELMHSIFEFGETTAKEIMVPRIDMVMADAETSRAEVLRLIAEHGHSRIPVYDGSVDKIIGVAHVRQLVQDGALAGGEATIREAVREVLFVPETKKIDELLKEFQAKKSHLAIVVDEYGGTSGMVTLEDVLEELVGEIEDEWDREEQLLEQLPNGTWRVAAKIDIDDLNDELNLQLPTENSDTLGGFIYELAGRVPSQGEVVDYQNLRFLIDRVHRQRIVRVRILPRQEVGA
ncbi:MAG: HlyC/CorC family transporter [Gemmatimonadetes bacterium]|nr:HlyC/CorC family transporter [Gemmatimonadota bacterium]